MVAPVVVAQEVLPTEEVVAEYTMAVVVAYMAAACMEVAASAALLPVLAQERAVAPINFMNSSRAAVYFGLFGRAAKVLP